MKLEKRRSAVISLVLCMILTIGLAALTVGLPWVWKWLILFFDYEQRLDSYCVTLGFLYPICLLGDGVAVMMILLLRRILNGDVFTAGSVALLRAISWCCILAAPLFAVIGYWYYSMFVPAFAAAFLGLVVRVVKNVIDQATAIKAENDLTV